MKKTIMLLVTILLLLPVLIASCGVAQEQYDAVVAERDAAQTQVESLQSDLATAHSQSEALQIEIEGLEEELGKAQGDHSALKQRVSVAELYGEMFEKYFFVPEEPFTTAEILDLSALVEETGDAELKEKWTTYLDTSTDESNIEFWLDVWDGLWEVLSATPSGDSA